MIFSQPTPPPPVAVPTPSPEVAVVEVKPAVAPAPQPSVSPASIVVPETIDVPQPSPSPRFTPEASPTPAASLTPTPSVSPSPLSQPSPSPQAVEAITRPSETAKDQRRQLLDQKLTDLLKQEKPAREAQSREVLIELILKYAHSGNFDKARRLTKDPVLPPEVQIALLRQISEIQAKGLALTPKKKNSNTVKPSAATGVPRPNGSSAGSASPSQAGNYSVSSFYSPRYTGPLPQVSAFIQRGLTALLYPLGIPAPITSLFGWRIHPISGVPRFHQGIDMGAPIGTPVIAAHTGKVELADILGGYGLTVILRHTDTVHSTLYGHLSQIFVQPGQVVKQGTVIALVGNTGNSTGPHLHFEVQQWTDQGWVAINPLNELRQASHVALRPSNPSVSQPLANFPSLTQGSALPPVPPLPQATGLPTVPTLVPLPEDDTELLANTPFAGLVNPAVTEEMGLIVPLALSAPIAKGLGWAVYPLVSQFTEVNSVAELAASEPMETVVVPARVSANPMPPLTSVVSAQPKLLSRAIQPQAQSVTLAAPKPKTSAVNWSPDIQTVKLPSLKVIGD